jgi:hypothetical protein
MRKHQIRFYDHNKYKKKEVSKMTFGEALNKVVEGKMVRRAEWEDERVFLTIANERLMISKPDTKTMDYLIVSQADIIAEDWVIYEQKEMAWEYQHGIGGFGGGLGIMDSIRWIGGGRSGLGEWIKISLY